MLFDDIASRWTPREVHSRASIDMWNSMAKGFGEKKLPDFGTDPFLNLLVERGMLGAGASALDVGCGTGGYALAIAGRCADVVGVDISPGMIELARERADEAGVRNVSFRCDDWHGFDLSAADYEKRFDLVFAHMTPAVRSAETFLMLGRASRAWCALAKPIRRVDPVSDEIKRLVGIVERAEEKDADFLYAFSLLYAQGLEPRVEYRRTRWNMRKPLDEAFGLYVNRVKTYRDIDDAEESAIRSRIEALAVDGIVAEDIDTTIATLYWHV